MIKKIMNSIPAWATKGDPVPRNQGLRSGAVEGPLAESELGCGIHSPTTIAETRQILGNYEAFLRYKIRLLMLSLFVCIGD